MSEVLAYFLTWTTYGTWLHGDERGSVDRAHSTQGTPLARTNSYRVSEMTRRMRTEPFVLNGPGREVVDATIRRHADLRRWEIRALNVRTNHVHVVVRVGERLRPEAVMAQFKAWSTRRLRAEGIVNLNDPVWTEHGSTRWIDSRNSLTAAVDYVNRMQDSHPR